MAASFNYETLFDYAGRTKSAAKLENQMSQSDFWNDSDTAQTTVAELKQLNTILKPLDESISAAGDLEALVELVKEEKPKKEEEN